MSGWDKMKFRVLQDKLEHCKLYGMQVDLDNHALALMAAYLTGVMDCIVGEVDESDIDGLEICDDLL